MNILVTGKNGQLGSEIQAIASIYPDLKFIFTDATKLDITNADVVINFFESNSIDLVINCAAYTAVDKAEDEPDIANNVNNLGVKNLVDSCIKHNARIIHISSDYVFNGTNHLPYIETDPINPIGVYGRTKYLGEKQILDSKVKGIIIRTSWVYSTFGNNFVKTMLRLAQERDNLNVIFDQIGSPTYARDLARVCLDIARQHENWSETSEVYHFSNEGVCSWYDLSIAIFKNASINCDVNPIESSEYITKAKRPHYSLLNKKKIKLAFGIEIKHWEESLSVMLSELN